jgi:hypothetical protein
MLLRSPPVKPDINNPAAPFQTTSALHWSAPLFLLLCLACTAFGAEKSGGAVAPVVHEPSPAIVIGFVGGFVHADDMRHAEVQLARKLSATYGGRIHSEIFDNHHEQAAYLAIRRWLDTDGDGDLSNAERQASRIILYGHSWGASAALTLARELQQANIPVLLTVQVDSIHKIGEDDHTVPANVSKAANFYQTRGLLHGHAQMTAADPAHTEILGQFHFDYPKMPSECRAYPWLNRFLFKGHTSIECDPNVWSQVGDLIDSVLSVGQIPSTSEATLR